MNKIALIPTYEPDEKLIKLVDDLVDNGFDVIVVDDGSGKPYEPIFNKLNNKIKMISYQENRGKGYALKRGLTFIQFAYANDPYIVVTMDSDGQHTINDALKLVKEVEGNDELLVLGSRPRNGNIPARSKIGNDITRFIYKLITGVDIYDTQTGLRAFSNKLMDYMLQVNANRYEYEMNVLLGINKNNIKYKEIKIESIYIDNNSGSHFNTFKDSFRIYKEIIKFSLSSLASFFLDYSLYALLLLVSNDVIIANILARVVSATFNYNVNRNIVFNSEDSIYKSGSMYLLLALVILIMNTLLLSLFVSLGINSLLAKVIVEVLLFSVSWIVQKKLIFNSKKVLVSEK
ncbi:MAG TPA: bifunctional glycosyltransferase family 2/GtrA family protein [Bacilli bacterium]|nr:bifunctional glycosyltransferase family 2/GtrA family protein [Bacilli bacterium]